MTATVPSPRNWLLPAGILVAMGLYLWVDPIAMLRTRQSAQAVKDDPNSGAAIGSTVETAGPILARRIDHAALSVLLKATAGKVRGTATFSVLVDAEGRVSDVRVIGGSLTPESAIAAVQALEGQLLFQPAPMGPTVRTLAGPLSFGEPAGL